MALDHLQFYHTSFSDFLLDPSRSKEYALRPTDLRTRFIEACFGALGKTKLRFAKDLSWPETKPNALTIAHRILSYAARHVWTICISLEDPPASLIDTITDFDFQQLVFVKANIPPSLLRAFADWLSTQVCGFYTWSPIQVFIIFQAEKQMRPYIVTWKELDPDIFVCSQSLHKSITCSNTVSRRARPKRELSSLTLSSGMAQRPSRSKFLVIISRFNRRVAIIERLFRRELGLAAVFVHIRLRISSMISILSLRHFLVLQIVWLQGARICNSASR